MALIRHQRSVTTLRNRADSRSPTTRPSHIGGQGNREAKQNRGVVDRKYSGRQRDLSPIEQVLISSRIASLYHPFVRFQETVDRSVNLLDPISDIRCKYIQRHPWLCYELAECHRLCNALVTLIRVLLHLNGERAARMSRNRKSRLW